MIRMFGFWILGLCLFLLIAGCQKAQHNGREESGPETRSGSSQQVEIAIQDLADRLGVPAGEIELVQEEVVTWRNGSLGCPKKGMMYTQALVEGALIVLGVEGKAYQYHSGKGLPPFYCESPEKPAAKPSLD